MTVPDISVIVPHYDDLLGLDRCLGALSAQRGLRNVEIIVADNASPQGFETINAVIAGRAKLVINMERGAGPTRNAAVAEASSPFLAFTDSDCIPRPEWLSSGLAALSGFDLAGGRMIVSTPEGRSRSGPEAFEAVFAFRNDEYVAKKGFTVTANLFCHRRVFERTGGFRSGVSEDLDWCHRATAHGFALGYAADAVVEHPPRADWLALRKKTERIDVEGFRLYSERPFGRLAWAFRALLLPGSIVVHIPRIIRADFLSPDEKLRAVANLVRVRLWRLAHAFRLLAGER